MISLPRKFVATYNIRFDVMIWVFLKEDYSLSMNRMRLIKRVSAVYLLFSYYGCIMNRLMLFLTFSPFLH